VNPESFARGRIAAAVAVALAFCAALLVSGVSVGELARFAAYEAIVVGAPGVLGFRALSRRAGSVVRQVAIGWPLGYAIEAAAFALTAALDIREAFPLIPLAVAAAAAARLRLLRETDPAGEPAAPPERDGSPGRTHWALAAVIAVALGYLALGSFASTPLPGQVDSAYYEPDGVFSVGLVAEAKNHWPMETPSVSGEPLRYHIFGFTHAAGVSQATGIPPATLLFRLIPAGMIVLVAFQLFALGRELGGSRWIGPIAAALFLLAGELDLDPERLAPFGETFTNLAVSPSFLFSIATFLGAATLLMVFLVRRETMRAGSWAALSALLMVCAGAKASVPPVLMGGLVMWLVWARLRDRDAVRVGLISLGLTVAAFVISYLLLYSGGGASGSSLELFQFLDYTVVEEFVPADTRSALGNGLLTGSMGIVALAALAVPLLGIVWVLRERGLRPTAEEAWLLGLTATSLAAFSVLAYTGEGQAHFLNYGYIAGCVLSAEGLVLFARHAATRSRDPRRLLAVALGAGIAAGAAAAWILLDASAPAGEGRFVLAYGIAAAVVAAVALWAALTGRAGEGAGRRLAATGIGAAILALVGLSLLNNPLDKGVTTIRRADAGLPLHAPEDPVAARGLTRELYEGLEWVRDNTDEDVVVAVNNHVIEGFSSRYFYYSAFAERRAFLESWSYTVEAQEIGLERVEDGEELPFPERRALNDAVFDRGDSRALERMRADYGVDFLVVDKGHGSFSPKALELGATVFENDAVAVIEVPEPA